MNSNTIKWSDIGGVFQGSAYLFGDQTGNARGAGALDLQSSRTAVTQVASGDNATCVGRCNTASGIYSTASGYKNTASGDYSTASGYKNTASGSKSTASGYNCTASGIQASAVGCNNTASGDYSFAIGNSNQATATNSFAVGRVAIASGIQSAAVGAFAIANISKTTNICGPQICRKDNGEAAGINFESFCGTQVILRTNEVDLKAAATHTITLPAGCHFFPDECGVNVTSLAGLTIQPTISFGRTGSNAALKAAAITTALTAQFTRERFQTLLSAAGETSLTATITAGATATTLLGTFYFKGILVEAE